MCTFRAGYYTGEMYLTISVKTSYKSYTYHIIILISFICNKNRADKACFVFVAISCLSIYFSFVNDRVA